MEYNKEYNYAVALKDKAQSIQDVNKGDILKKITSNWIVLKTGVTGWTVNNNEFEYFNSMGGAKEYKNRLLGNINSKSIEVGDYIVWNNNGGQSPGEIDTVVEPINDLDCLILEKYSSFDIRKLTGKDKEANWFTSYEEAQRYSDVLRNQPRIKIEVPRAAIKDESLHDFKIDDEVKCIDVVTNFKDCSATTNGYAEWREMDEINIGDILKIKSIKKVGIKFYNKGYYHSPSAFVKVNSTKQDSNKSVQEFMAKFSHMEDEIWIGSEWISGSDSYYKERFASPKFDLTDSVPIEEVSPHLPKNHPDKIKTMQPKKKDLVQGELYKYDNQHLAIYPDGPSLTTKEKVLDIKNYWQWNLNVTIPTPEEKQLFQDYLNKYYKIKYDTTHIGIGDPKELTKFPETGKLLYKTKKKSKKRSFKNTVKVKI